MKSSLSIVPCLAKPSSGSPNGLPSFCESSSPVYAQSLKWSVGVMSDDNSLSCLGSALGMGDLLAQSPYGKDGEPA